MIPLNWKLKLLPSHFGLLMPLNQQTEKSITVVVEVINSDSQEVIGLLLHNENKEEDVKNTEIP